MTMVASEPMAVRATRAWLLVLTLAFLLFGVYAGRWFSRPTIAIVAFILLIMAPFSVARLWVVRKLATAGVAGIALAVLCSAFASFDAVMVAQLTTARTNEASFLLSADFIMWIGPVWFSAHVMIVGALATLGSLRWLHWRLKPRRADARSQLSQVSHNRREFLRRVSQAGVGVPFALSLSGVETSYDFQVDEHEIEIAGWPAALDGMRVAHLSDIHVGGAMDAEKLAHVVELTNAADPELVLHTGDFLTHRLPGFDEPLYPALARIRSPHGQLACFGNHDFDDPTRLAHRLLGSGVDVLRNRVVSIEVRGRRIEIGGVDFASFGPEREVLYARAMRHWPPRTRVPRILLCHDPTAFSTLPRGCADLVLSGHTHGGHLGIQIDDDTALTLLGVAGFPDQGVFLRDDMKMFVTRCVGFYGYPIRLGIKPEIAILILRSPGNVA